MSEENTMGRAAEDVPAVEKPGQVRDGIVAELRKAFMGRNDVIDGAVRCF